MTEESDSDRYLGPNTLGSRASFECTIERDVAIVKPLVQRWPSELEGRPAKVLSVLELRASVAFGEAEIVARVGEAREPGVSRRAFPSQLVSTGAHNSCLDGCRHLPERKAKRDIRAFSKLSAKRRNERIPFRIACCIDEVTPDDGGWCRNHLACANDRHARF